MSRLLLVCCALVSTVCLAQAKKTNPKLMPFKNDVVACEQRLEKGYGDMAVNAAANGERSRDRVAPSDQSDPEFAELAARLEACATKAKAMAGGAENLNKAKELVFHAANSAGQARTLLGDGTSQESDRSKGSKSVDYYKDCLKKLDEAFALSAEAKDHDVSHPSGQIKASALQAECQKGAGAAEQLLGEAKATEEKGAKAQLQKIFKNEWARIQGNLAQAKKELATNDPLAPIDADSKLYYYEHDLEFPRWLRQVKEILGSFPALETFELESGLTAKAFAEKMEAIGKQASAERAKIKDKVRTALGQYDKETQKAVKGDRLDILKKNGRPNWIAGAEKIQGARAGVNHHARAEWFRYDGANGCKTTYHFSGDALQKTTNSPEGCRRR